MLVEHGEAGKAAGLPDASDRPRWIGDHRLTAEIVDHHRREMYRGAVSSGELEGALDIVRREKGLPRIVGARLAHVAHRSGDRNAGAVEHEVAAVIRPRLACLPAEQLGIETAASYNQNLWIAHLSGGAAYLPR